jgi:hypothetical protein
MRLRLAVAATVAALATGPFLTTSHAAACNERDFPEVCAALYAVCQSTATTQRICSLFG